MPEKKKIRTVKPSNKALHGLIGPTLEGTIDPDKIWVTCSYKVTMGNYQNFEMAIGRSMTLTSKDDPDASLESLMNKLTRMVIIHCDDVQNNPDDYLEDE